MEWLLHDEAGRGACVTVILSGRVADVDGRGLVEMVETVLSGRDLAELRVDFTYATVDIPGGGLRAVHAMAARLRTRQVSLVLQNPSHDVEERLALLLALGNSRIDHHHL